MSTRKKPKRWRKKQKPAPIGQCVFVILIGLILGAVFTFGEQYWSAEVSRNDCNYVETRFLSYEELHKNRYSSRPRGFAIDCADGERYFIDRVSVNTELKNALSVLSEQEEISLLLHPNSDTILEFSCEHGNLLIFEDTLSKLRQDAQGFFYLGLFMYFCALVGLVELICSLRHRAKR